MAKPRSRDWVVTSATIAGVGADVLTNAVSIAVAWSAQTVGGEPCGFGEVTYRKLGDDPPTIDTETLSKEFALKVFQKLIEDATVVDPTKRMSDD